MPIKNFSVTFFFLTARSIWTPGPGSPKDGQGLSQIFKQDFLVWEHATTVEPLLRNTVMITQNVALSNASQKQIVDLALISLSGTGPWKIQTPCYVPLAFLKVSFVTWVVTYHDRWWGRWRWGCSWFLWCACVKLLYFTLLCQSSGKSDPSLLTVLIEKENAKIIKYVRENKYNIPLIRLQAN